MKTKLFSFIFIIVLLLNLFLPIISEANNIISEQISVDGIEVKYSSHIQDIGWQDYVKNGEESGTTGRNLKIEAIKIDLINKTSNVSVKYTTYVEGIEWQEYVKNGEESGTTGKNLKIEGIKICLEGTDEYSIMYRTHIQDYGWQDWKYDNEISGKINAGKKIEAIEIKIIPKIEKEINVKYSSHVQDIGWQKEMNSGEISGTVGQNLKIEALKIELENSVKGMEIRYKTYIENNGWQHWIYNGNISGTTGKNLKVYGVRIELIGTNEYSIQYRVHSQDDGWGDWKNNGDVAGNITQNKKIEGIQIRIVKQNNIQNEIGVEYYTYLQGVSLNENKVESNGDISGTTGENRMVEAIQIELKNASSNSHVKYKTHIQNVGWVDWTRDGQISGIINSGLKIEAIKIELEGMLDYTIEYKVHVQDVGWTEWHIDGETAGTTGKNKRIEAIQIRIVEKQQKYYKGIDVSYWQGNINFDKLENSGQIDYIITRIGWYSHDSEKLVIDTKFERNYKETRNRNIALGAYFYSYATSIEGAKKEAESVVDYLKNSAQTNYELPIFYDIEDDRQISLGKDTITQMSIVFCETLKNAGFNVGVYSYSYWLENYMNLNLLPNDYSIWVAHYDKEHDGTLPENIYKYADKYDMWQYSSKGSVSGINGDVDMNICYKKYF